ncbi:MAG: glycoside hydrolase family 88 protein, partial [Bacteroidota bacterium]|nr:glycoside hydrolase family 88 protein [Bacteroidota bacterium]
PFHYKWDEWDNGGFSLLGHLFRASGMQTRTLSAAPSKAALSKSDIYIIVDADNAVENPDPHFMTDSVAAVIHDWVKAGGVLLILHNDKGNADFAHINLLSDRLGIHFNEDSYNAVIKNDYKGGAIPVAAGNPVLPHEKQIYQKEICSMTLHSPAKAVLQKGDLVILAAARIGKGCVLASGDPWLYNEYTDGRKLPLVYENFGAAKDLVSWLIQQIPPKKMAKQ